MLSIGERVKMRRHEVGLNLSEVTLEVEVVRSALNKIEMGLQYPSSDVIVRNANNLNTTGGWPLGDLNPNN